MPQRIGLFGGTFDPVHLGHIGIAKAALAHSKLDQVRFLPCRQSPHKLDSTPPSASAHRLAMLKLATAELTWAEVDPFELHQPLPSYSWRTAEAFAGTYRNAELFWIMGTDQWKALNHWAEWRRLASLVHFIVFQRGEFPVERNGVNATFIRGDFPISASAIREGKSTGEYSIPSVIRYRKNHGF